MEPQLLHLGRNGVGADRPGWDAVAHFVDRLRRLRRLAGSPSLNRLAALTSRLERPLPRSTISDKLNVRSLPDWDFVVSFVTACRAHAQEVGPPLPAHLTDLDGWDAAHLRMLRAVDEERAERCLVVAAHADLDRRAGRDSMEGQRPAVERPAVERSAVERSAVEPDGDLGVPHQLPATGQFVGRTAELEQLGRLLDGPAATDQGTVIVTVSGMAGVGKTALALHWAHRTCDRFPDGQLYVNLRGMDPTGAPTEPADALQGFLEAFRVPRSQIPIGLDAKAARYRSVVRNRRIIVVLDDAADPEQVRPLLPGSAGCLVLVTSRNRLTSLVVKEGATPLTVDPLSAGEARELLTRCLGPDRVVADLPAVDGIVARCSRLPLALTVVAARAATYPQFPLAALRRELTEAHGSLDAFNGGDAATDVRAVFSWSYRRLQEPTARLFRLLGWHPGPEISTAAAASLAGAPLPHTRRMLAELTHTHLVEEHTPGRFGLHDLLRAYARELVLRNETKAERRAALRRTLDHYLHAAFRADRLLNPHRRAIALTASDPQVASESPIDQPRALPWFTAEHPVLLALIRLATEAGFDAYVWQLAWTLGSYLDLSGHWQDWLATQRTAVEAANRVADPPAQARTYLDLGRVCCRLGRFGDADAHLRHALGLFNAHADGPGAADARLQLAIVCDGLGRKRQAMRHVEQALALFRAAGHAPGQAAALDVIGRNYALLADHHKALTHCRQALELHRELGDRHGEAKTWNSLGLAHRDLGHHRQAAVCLRRALRLFRDIGDAYNEADTLTHLGDTLHAVGEAGTAREAWQQALAVFGRLQHPRTDRLRTRLYPPLVAVAKVSTQM